MKRLIFALHRSSSVVCPVSSVVRPLSSILCLLSSVVCLLSFSGCASYLAVQNHNATVDVRVLQLRAMPETDGIALEIDLLSASKTYLSAWKAHPWQMGAATVVDLAATYGISVLAQDATDSSGSSDPTAGGGLPSQINSGGGDVIIINNGGSVNENRDWSSH